MSADNAQDYGREFAQTITEWWKAYEAGEEIEGQDAGDFLSEATYGYTLRPGAPFRVTLAGGGPSAWLEATLDEDGDVEDAALMVAWWSEPVSFRSEAITSLTRYYAESVRDF